MPRFRELKNSTREGREEFLTEVKEREPRVNPRLTFPFPLSKEREMALEQAEAESPDAEKVLEMAESDDFVVRKIGFLIAAKNPDLFKSMERMVSLAQQSVEKQEQDGEEAMEFITKAGTIGEEFLERVIANCSFHPKIREKALVAVGGSRPELADSFRSILKNKDNSFGLRLAAAEDMARLGLLDELISFFRRSNDVSSAETVTVSASGKIDVSAEMLIVLACRKINEDRAEEAGLFLEGLMTRKTPGFLYKERALSVLTSLVERGLYFRDCLSRVIKENYQKEDASFSSSAINSLLDSGRPADIALVGEIFENKKDNPGFIWLCAVSMPGKLKKEGAFLIKPFIEAAEKITGFSQTPRIIESIKEAGPDGLPVLLEVKNWAKDYKKYENVAALALGEMGPAAIPFLREIALNSNREAKAQALVSLIKLLPDSWTVIEEISQVGDPDLSRPALRFLKGTRKNLSLGRKPLFATLFQEELEWRLGYLNEITEQLRAEFPTDFIGISVFGSHSRGHVKPGSDLDFMLLARDRKVYERFHEVVKLVIPLCVENCYFAEINGDNRLKEKKYGFGALYYGLFFGDLEALTEIQNNSMFSQKDYDNYRAYVLDKESYFSKSYAIKQTPQGNNKVKYHAWLTRVPPPYEETKKLLEKRIRRTKVKK